MYHWLKYFLDNFFCFIRPREYDDYFRKIGGVFYPHHSYNMDQVLLPFVNDQDEKNSMVDSNDINFKFPTESLHKHQFTMYIVFNSGIEKNLWLLRYILQSYW